MRLRVLLAMMLLAAAACDHDMRVKLQEEQLAPQLNYGRSKLTQKDVVALTLGMPQKDVLESFGTPILVHHSGNPCTPWNSCVYETSYLVYRTSDNYLCRIHFARNLVAKKSECAPYRTPPVLGPGDLDPHTGMTGNL